MTVLTHSVTDAILVGSGGSSGMPQLDPTSFSSQLFWLAVTFTVLYIFMDKMLIPRIRNVLEKRQTQIEHDINAAEKAKNDAEKARQSYESDLTEARINGNKTIAEAQSTIDRMVAEQNTKLDEKLAKQMAKSEEQIAAQADKAKAEIEPLATELAGLIAESLSGTKPAAKTISSAVKAEMKG